MVFRFAEYLIDSSEQLFLKHGTPVRLSPAGFAVLQVLLENQGTILGRETLERLPDVGEPRALNDALAEIGRALQEPDGTRWIEETAEGGVRFLGQASTQPEIDRTPQSAPSDPFSIGGGNELFQFHRQPKRRSHAHWVAPLLLVASLAVIFYLSYRNRPEPLPVTLATRELTFSGHEKGSLALGRNGTTAWYSEQDHWLRLWQLSLPDGKAHPLASEPRFQQQIQAVSSDGEWLLVRRKPVNGAGTGLWQMDKDGNGARLLVANGWSGAWSPNGRQLAFSLRGDHRVYLAQADGSHAHSIARVPGYPWYLTWTPEGDRLLLASIPERTPSEPYPEGPLFRAFVATGRLRPIQDDTGNAVEGSHPVIAADHRHILFTHTSGTTANIWEVDRQSGHLLTVTSNRVNTRLAAIGPMANQIIVARETLHARLLRLQPQNHHLEPFPAPIETRDLAFSPDGKWMAYVDLQGALWQARSDGSQPVRLLDTKWRASEPAWATNSKQLIVSAAPQGGLPKLYRLPATASTADNAANPITTGMGADRDASWSSDRKHVLFCRTVSGVSQLEWLNLDSGVLQTVPDSRGKCSPRLSPYDLLSATNDASDTLFIRRGLQGEWERILTDPSGIHDNYWSRDGRSLYFLTGSAKSQWKRYDLHDGRITTVADLGPAADWLSGPWHSLALTADDGLVIAFDISGSEFYLVTLGSDEG